MIFNISSSLRHARAMHRFVNWLIWKHLKKITFTTALEGGEAAAPTGVWEGGLQHLGKKTLDMASHYEHENNSEESHCWNAQKKSKIIYFKSRMAPNDNIPANILGVLQKMVQWLGWTRLLWKSGIAGVVLLIYSQESSFLNWRVVQPEQSAIESRAG